MKRWFRNVACILSSVTRKKTEFGKFTFRWKVNFPLLLNELLGLQNKPRKYGRRTYRKRNQQSAILAKQIVSAILAGQIVIGKADRIKGVAQGYENATYQAPHRHATCFQKMLLR
jgi:hypothetical protein